MKTSFLFATGQWLLFSFVVAGCSGSMQSAQEVTLQLSGQDEADPPDFVEVEKQPVPFEQHPPVYPSEARRRGLEGTVWLKVLVTKDGAAKKAVVVKSDNHIFEKPAMEAAMKWKFEPAIMKGSPVATWVAIPFRFKLNY